MTPRHKKSSAIGVGMWELIRLATEPERWRSKDHPPRSPHADAVGAGRTRFLLLVSRFSLPAEEGHLILLGGEAACGAVGHHTVSQRLQSAFQQSRYRHFAFVHFLCHLLERTTFDVAQPQCLTLAYR